MATVTTATVAPVAVTTAAVGREVPAVWLDQWTDFWHDLWGRPVDGSGVTTSAVVASVAVTTATVGVA